MVRLPFEPMVTELAKSRSKPIDIGVEPTVMGLENVMFPVMGPGIVAWTGALVVGSIYITVAEAMEIDAPV
jgi:hypothetical protein